MRIAVTGSIATDHLMRFPGRFTDQLIPEQLHRLSLSFLVDDLQVRRGGVAANVAFGMACLGLRPVLVAAVGTDFVDYRAWLERHGVDTSGVHVSELAQTARFLCTTDDEQNQIASFYTGAMSEARNIELAPIAERVGGLDLVLIGPNDPEAMLRHTEECRARGLPFAADPSQQLARMDGGDIRALVSGAAYLFTNDYEASLTETKTGWSAAQVLEQVGVRVTTHGPRGAVVETRGQPPVSVPAPDELCRADPTGVGDGFRAGYLAAVAWGLGPQRCAEVGCMLATLVLETVGTQEYELRRGHFLQRFADCYGEPAADEVAAHLHGVPI